MATEFGTNDAQTVKHWSRVTFREAISKTLVGTLMRSSSGDDGVVQRLVELERDAGDVIKYDQLAQNTDYGTDGDTEIKGQESSLTYYQDSIGIDQKRLAHAFRRMSQQRTLHDLRADARSNLSDRWSVIYDEFAMAYLAGTAASNSGLAGVLSTTAASSFAGNALRLPDSNHLINVSGITINSVTTGTTDAFSTDHIVRAKARAKGLSTNPIRPARVRGFGNVYVMILHPNSVYQMKIETGSTKWTGIMQQAAERGRNNPLFTGDFAPVGMIDNVLLFESNYIPYDTTNSVAYNLFLGRQALAWAFGNAYDRLDRQRVPKGDMFSWFEDMDDYGNRKGIATGSVFGMQKCRFNSVDNACIVVATQDAAA